MAVARERGEVGIVSHYLVDTECKFYKMERALEVNGGDGYTI